MLSRVYHKTLSGIMDSLVERTRKVDTSDEPYIHGIPVCPSSGNFVVVVYPPPVWPDKNRCRQIKLLFSYENLYLVGFFCSENNRWMVFKDSDRDIYGVSADMLHNWTRKLHFDGGYGSMEAIFSKGILGMRALHKLYRCVARFPNISSEDQVKKVVLIAVVAIPECIRFPVLRRRMFYTLENKEDDRKVDSPAPYETYTSSYAFDKHFHNRSTYCDVIRAGEDAYNRLFEDIPPQDDRRTDEQKKKDQDQRTVLLNAGLDSFTKLKKFVGVILHKTQEESHGSQGVRRRIRG